MTLTPTEGGRGRFRRREVLAAACAATWLGARPRGASSAPIAPTATATTLAGAMAGAGFDPNRPGAFTAVFTADVHYGTGNPAAILAPVFAEVNRMDPLPAFFGVAGDMICKASLAFGNVPGEDQRLAAVAEFRLFRHALSGLDRRVPLKLALGNHDTYPGEDRPRLFQSVFADCPEYHAFTIKDVAFVFLNGGSNGALDDEQQDWFRQCVRDRHRRGGTLITVLHQPSLGSLVKERGVTRSIRDGLGDVRGDLWTIGGHEHRNAIECFRLPHGAGVTQATITKGNPAVWGEEPGYWIWCFEAGRLVTRIFHRVGGVYTVAPPSPRDRARPLLLPFEGRESQLLWKVLVGEGDTPFLIEYDAAWCLNYWFYTKHLTYRFPLNLGGPTARRLCVLETHAESSRFRCQVGPDPQRLAPVELAERDGSYSFIAIPRACRDAGHVTVRLEGCTVSGFALTT